jgi:hypothetical protein
MSHNTQPYDSSLKALFEGHIAEIIPHLFPGARFSGELNDEVLKPPVRADRVYIVDVYNAVAVVHIEMETGADAEIAYRLLEYYGILLKKHQEPLISIVIYPFRTILPESPLRVKIGGEEVLTFHFRVIALWKLNAQYFIERHVIGFYPLLPTMQGATYRRLVDAIEELKLVYNNERRKLAELLLWFGTFLKRTDMVEEADKRKLEIYMNQFESLLEENSFVQRFAAKADEKARLEELRRVLTDIVGGRFPALTDLAQVQGARLAEPEALRALVHSISRATDEKTARDILLMA